MIIGCGSWAAIFFFFWERGRRVVQAVKNPFRFKYCFPRMLGSILEGNMASWKRKNLNCSACLMWKKSCVQVFQATDRGGNSFSLMSTRILVRQTHQLQHPASNFREAGRIPVIIFARSWAAVCLKLSAWWPKSNTEECKLFMGTEAGKVKFHTFQPVRDMRIDLATLTFLCFFPLPEFFFLQANVLNLVSD